MKKTSSRAASVIQNIADLTCWLVSRVGVGWNEIKQDYDAGPTDRSADQAPVDQDDNGTLFNLGLTAKPVDWASFFIAYGEERESFSFGGTLNCVSDRPDSESENLALGFKLQDPDNR